MVKLVSITDMMNQDFYLPAGISYLGLRMFDTPQTNISKHFDTAATFIEQALTSQGQWASWI